jgi:hypothetical protein
VGRYAGIAAGAAFHRAATALFRGQPGQSAGGIRHRPPSTYAAIISTLLAREYAVLDNRRFKPTDIGRIVNRFLTRHFTQYVDYDFTARLEDKLDAVSRGEEDWVPLMREFWDPFKQLVEEKAESVSRQEVVQSRELGLRPQDRQTGFGADGPIRAIRADRRQGRCG